MPSSKRAGLRARIIVWTFLPTMALLGAVALYTFATFERVTASLAMERNRDRTALLAEQMAVELTRHVDTLNALAMTADLRGLEPAHVRTALQWWVGTLRDFDGGVLVLDAAGRVFVEDPRAIAFHGADLSGQSFFQRLSTTGQVPFFTDVLALPDGRPAVGAVLRLDGPGGQMRGALVGLFLLEPPAGQTSALYRSLLRFDTRPSEARLYLVDGEGRLIDPRRRLAAGQVLTGWPAIDSALGSAGERVSGALRTAGLEGGEAIASYAPVPDTPWMLFQEEDWASVTALTRQTGRGLLALLLAGLVVPPVLLAFGLRRVLHPVQALTAAALRIATSDDDALAAGALEQRVIAAAGDELAELAGAFNAMADRLRTLYGSLERQVADRTRELATLNGVTRAVNASLDLRETLAAALDRTMAAMGAHSGLIYAARTGSERRELVARGVDDEMEAAVRSALGRNEPLEAPQGTLSAPLEAQGEVVGGLWLWPSGGGTPGGGTPGGDTPGVDAGGLLRAIGQGVGVAAENARLYAEVEREAVVSERNRIARELHDSVTQTLFSANLIAGVLPLLWEQNPEAGRTRLAELRELTQGALAEMRMLLLELRPQALEAADLSDLLSQLRAAVSARARVPVALEVTGEGGLPVEVRLALYRVAQEALNNAVRHAGASALVMTLELGDGRARLTVADDGQGFDPEQAPADRLGLSSMRERMAAVGGGLEIGSTPGAGTTIVAAWPADREG
ncbi:MAG: sensor histidine kinase [Anaerolineae bacterium]